MGNKPSLPHVRLSKERIVIVTGANTGIGYETAKWIAKMGATVIIACRSQHKALEAIEKMQLEARSLSSTEEWLADSDDINVQFMELDLASLDSTMKFINDFKKTGLTLNVLICNAGIGMHKKEYTVDGHELHFQVNYLGHFLIAAHLLPIMKCSGPDSRIVLVSSVMHTVAKFDLETLEARGVDGKRYDRLDYYGRSKLYQIMQMYSMNRRLRDTNVAVTTLHPGIVLTDLDRNFMDITKMKIAMFIAKLIGATKTPYEGAITSINAAVNPLLAGVRDVYYDNCKPKRIKSTARNIIHQEALWTYTLHCLKDFLNEDIKTVLEGDVNVIYSRY